MPSKKMTRHHSSPFPACFRPPSTTRTLQPANPPHAPPPQPPPPTTPPPNLTTSLYQTNLGLFSLTWSRSLLARTLHLHLHPSPTSSFHLTLLPFLFWSNHGVKLLPFGSPDNPLHILWDFTRAKFGSGPEPDSGYYIGIVSANASPTVLFVGDMEKSFHSRVKAHFKNKLGNSHPDPLLMAHQQSMVVRREHVCGTQFYTTKTTIGGKTRVILIEVSNKTVEDDPRLVIRVDNKWVIQVKHLKWKFRGSERFDVDGHRVQLSWDVYNWLFDDGGSGGGGGNDEGYALFTFRFEKGLVDEGFDVEKRHCHNSYDSNERVLMWSHDSCGLSYERKKMKKKLLVKTSSSSSSSLSSASSSGSSSIMEWESVEENELKAPTGFSLLVYAWKS